MSIGVTLTEAAWAGLDSNAQALVDRWLVTEGTHVSEGDVLDAWC